MIPGTTTNRSLRMIRQLLHSECSPRDIPGHRAREVHLLWQAARSHERRRPGIVSSVGGKNRGRCLYEHLEGAGLRLAS